MNKKELKEIIDKEAERVNSDFHVMFRTRWNIDKMVKRGLKRLANKIRTIDIPSS